MDKDQVIYVGAKKDIIDMASLKTHLLTEIASIKSKNPKCQPSIVLSIDRRVDYGVFLRLFSVVQECSPRIRLSYKPQGVTSDRLCSNGNWQKRLFSSQTSSLLERPLQRRFSTPFYFTVSFWFFPHPIFTDL